MELDLCLYCEKRLMNESTAFCSTTCQSNEASKSSSPIQISINNALSKPYSMSYHRRPSLSYSTSTSTTSSRRARKESSPVMMPSSLSHNTNDITRIPPFFLVQSMSTASSFSSSLSDISVFSALYSCEDKAATICAPYHNTRTTQNIAS